MTDWTRVLSSDAPIGRAVRVAVAVYLIVALTVSALMVGRGGDPIPSFLVTLGILIGPATLALAVYLLWRVAAGVDRLAAQNEARIRRQAATPNPAPAPGQASTPEGGSTRGRKPRRK